MKRSGGASRCTSETRDWEPFGGPLEELRLVRGSCQDSIRVTYAMPGPPGPFRPSSSSSSSMIFSGDRPRAAFERLRRRMKQQISSASASSKTTAPKTLPTIIAIFRCRVFSRLVSDSELGVGLVVAAAAEADADAAADDSLEDRLEVAEADDVAEALDEDDVADAELVVLLESAEGDNIELRS